MASMGKSILTLGVDNQMTAGLNKAREDINKTGKSAKDLDGRLRLMRGGVGQLGHQIQDMAVQAQMGTDAFIILGQQGSQVAALLGPGGAMFGAVLAIGAAIAGPLIKHLSAAGASMEDLAERVDALSESSRQLFPELEAVARAMQDQRVRERADEIADLTEKNNRLKKELIDTRDGTLGAALSESKRARILADISEKIVANNQNMAVARAEIVQLVEVQDEEKDSTDKVTDALEEQNAALKKSVDTYGMNSVQMAVYEAAKDGVITSLERENIALTGSLLQLQLNTQATKDAAKAESDLAKEIERTEQARLRSQQAAGSSALGLFQSLLGEEEQIQVELEKRQSIVDEALRTEAINISMAEALRTMIVADAAKKRTDIAEKEAADQASLRQKAIQGVGDQLMSLDANNKKVFQMQKGYRMAEATISAFQAANNALAAPFPFPIPQAMAATALTLGLANVAQIKAQSFAGGGFTGYGARAGGLDGKGGRMAMIHPNETIIDHRNGGAAGVTIVNNVDARGAGADVDQKIKVAMAQTSQQTVLTIQDLMRRRRLV